MEQLCERDVVWPRTQFAVHGLRGGLSTFWTSVAATARTTRGVRTAIVETSTITPAATSETTFSRSFRCCSLIWNSVEGPKDQRPRYTVPYTSRSNQNRSEAAKHRTWLR